MNKIPCEVVRDLLPLYVDRLTNETTNELIREHLRECPECRKIFASMQGGDPLPEESTKEEKEIDFLKKNKKRNRRIMLFSILGALLLLVSVLGVRFFLIGTDGFSGWTAMKLEVNGKQLHFTAVPMDSASAISSLRYTEENGIVTVKARAVLVSPLFRGSRTGSYEASEPIKEVRIGNRIIWSEGAAVSAMASELFATAHEYIGDMSANQRTANALSLGAYLGPYTNELETSEEPYGWKLILTDDVTEEQHVRKERDMDAFGRVLVALIGNLDHVSFIYEADGKETVKTVTAAEISAWFGEDVKNCGRDIRALDRLLLKTGLNLYTTVEDAYQDSEETVWIRILNASDTEILSISGECFLNGESRSTFSGEHADKSTYEQGSVFYVDVQKDLFGGDWDNDPLLEIAFSFTAADGERIEIPEKIRITSVPGTMREFRLAGDRESGYRLEQ